MMFFPVCEDLCVILDYKFFFFFGLSILSSVLGFLYIAVLSYDLFRYVKRKAIRVGISSYFNHQRMHSFQMKVVHA